MARQLQATPSHWQGIAVAALAIALYAATIGFGTALDDGLVLSDNAYVLQGPSGIGDILTHDSFHGSIGESANLTGGRYRPLAQVMYALEVGIAGGVAPKLHHTVNVLLYALTALVLLRFLQRRIMPGHTMAALATVVLFVVHPLHTEVVANIKGRDELLSLLLLTLTLDRLLAWAENGKATTLAMASGLLFLALLAKENGVILAALVPVTFHVLTHLRPRAWWPAWTAVALVLGAYALLRTGLIGTQVREVTEVMDNPYLLASTAERIGTILHVFGRYLLLLIWPHPLTYDHSYAQIAYRTPADPTAWVPGLLLVALAGLLVPALRRRDVLGWCITFFLLTWGLVSGLVFNIGAPLGERFMYQGSLPFLVAVVVLAERLLDRWAPGRAMRQRTATAAFTLLALAGVMGTAYRLPAWRDNDTLLLNDVAISDRSVRANTYAGIAAIHRSDAATDRATKRDWAFKALDWFAKAAAIKADYVPIPLNAGVAWIRLDSVERAEAMWDRVRLLEPDNALLRTYDEFLFNHYHTSGLRAGAERNFTKARQELEKAVRYGPANADAWYNLGGACFSAGDMAGASQAWERSLQLKPDHPGALQGMAALPK